MKLPMPFDSPSTYPGHSGVDFGEREGTPIKASGYGVVTNSGYWNERAGWATIVKYDNGPLVLYCHQPKLAARPREGARIVPGGYLGAVGNTGSRSTGPHLHMEIMAGEGAHTYEGVWLYFDKNRVIGQGSTSGGGSSTAPGIPPTIEEDEEMTPRQIHYTKGGKTTRALIVPGTEYFMPWTESTAVYANGFAKNMETGSSTEVTESLFNAFKAAAERCARTTVKIDTVEA